MRLPTQDSPYAQPIHAAPPPPQPHFSGPPAPPVQPGPVYPNPSPQHAHGGPHLHSMTASSGGKHTALAHPPGHSAPPPPPGAPPPPGLSPTPVANHGGPHGGSQATTVNARSTLSATESSVPVHTAHSTQDAAPSSATTHGAAPLATSSFGQTTLGPRQPPAAGATVREHMEFVHYQLDTLAGREVLGGLVLEPGMSNRMQGGALRRCALRGRRHRCPFS